MSAPQALMCDSDRACSDWTHHDDLSQPDSSKNEDVANDPFVTASQIVELILKDRNRLHLCLRTTRRKMDLASRLLWISLASFVLFGVAMALTFDAAGFWPHTTPIAQWLKAHKGGQLLTFTESTGSLPYLQSLLSGQAARFAAAYAFGLIATSGVCLPSLYFFALLSGLRMTMVDVVLHTLKGTAVTAMALIGIFPLYAAIVLGAIVFHPPAEAVQTTLFLGLCLPFLAGLWGTRSLYVGFADLCGTMPETFQTKRACFLRRLVFSWCLCYTAVAPVMIVTVWEACGR